MFKSTLLIVVLLVFTLGCSKEIRKEYYPNGKLKSSCEYNNDGMLDGYCKRFSIEGYLLIEEEYKNNIRHGRSIGYSSNNKVVSDCTFKNGKEDGLLKGYDQNGKLKNETTYKDGVKDGPYKEYHENGKLYHEIVYRDGKEDTIRYYYPNGQVSLEQKYTDFSRVGPGEQKKYYKDGKLKEESTFSRDGKTLTKKYDENGNLQ